MKRQHPQALQPYLPEITQFAQHNHTILHTILRYDSPPGLCRSEWLISLWYRLLARGLELDEDTFVKQHQWSADSETYGQSFGRTRFLFRSLTCTMRSEVHEIVSQ